MMQTAERKYSLSHVGEIQSTNEGYQVKVIDGGFRVGYCLIEFTYNNTKLEVIYAHVKDGNIKNPYHKSVLGVGYLGVGKYNSRENKLKTQAYSKWNSMMNRCYNKKSQEIRPTYKGVAVAKEWHNFQNFAEWFYSQPYSNHKKIALDKDISSISSEKIYSPDTCNLIPSFLNNFMTNKQASNTSEYIGVSWHKRDKKWRVQISNSLNDLKKISLGYYDNLKEASTAYKKARKIEVEKIKAQLQKDYPLLDKRIIENIS